MEALHPPTHSLHNGKDLGEELFPPSRHQALVLVLMLTMEPLCLWWSRERLNVVQEDRHEGQEGTQWDLGGEVAGAEEKWM